jgi:hypothetical protein
MTRRRWRIRRNSVRKPRPQRLWVVDAIRTGMPTWQTAFPTWEKALRYTQEAISRAAVEDVLERAIAVPGEFEAVEACLIFGHDLENKRMRIYDAGRFRGLRVRTEVEEESDTRDTLILISVRRDATLPLNGSRSRYSKVGSR